MLYFAAALLFFIVFIAALQSWEGFTPSPGPTIDDTKERILNHLAKSDSTIADILNLSPNSMPDAQAHLETAIRAHAQAAANAAFQAGTLPALNTPYTIDFTIYNKTSRTDPKLQNNIAGYSFKYAGEAFNKTIRFTYTIKHGKSVIDTVTSTNDDVYGTLLTDIVARYPIIFAM